MEGGRSLDLTEELVLREVRRERRAGAELMKALCERFRRQPQSPSEEPSSSASVQSGGDLSRGEADGSPAALPEGQSEEQRAFLKWSR